MIYLIWQVRKLKPQVRKKQQLKVLVKIMKMPKWKKLIKAKDKIAKLKFKLSKIKR